MPTIAHITEADGPQPDYSGREFTPEEISKGLHRKFVGGVWESHGKRQVDYLVKQGLQPDDRLLDVGCGCLRAGRLFVDYLNPRNYYGIDANHSVVEAGYTVELSDRQRDRLPAANLRANDRFDVEFGVNFDYALAQSVFSHVSLNHIRLCLYRVSKVMKPGGVFYTTFFKRDEETTAIDRIIAPHKAKPFFTEKNVYWYYPGDLEWASTFSPWKFTYIGDWGHPANQRMAKFTRISDEEWAEARATGRPASTRPVSVRPTDEEGAEPQHVGEAPRTEPGTNPTGASDSQPPTLDELKQLAARGLRWASRRLDS